MRKSFFIVPLFVLFACKSKIAKIKPTVSAITESVYASGKVKSNRQYQAFATISGVIQTVYVHEGDLVKTGTPILSIVSKVQQLNQENALLTARNADVASNQGKLKEAQQTIALQNSKMKNDFLLLTRQQNLWQEKIGTKVELEQRQLAYESSKTAYQSAVIQYNDLQKQLNFAASQSKKYLEISETQASDFTLKSEVDGVVYKLYKEKGEIANPQTPLALIGGRDQFILEMQVDEYDIFKVKKDQMVLVTMDSYKGQVFEAKVSNILPMMDESSKTFLVEATFVHPPETLYPFISFEANIVIQTKENALLIPRNLLLNDSTVVLANGKNAMVKIGLKDYQMVEILSGISAKDELVNPIK